MLKYSWLEKTEVVDQKTGKIIFVSTTVRKFFREAWHMEDVRNARLNLRIAADFIKSTPLHYFWIKKEEKIIGEVRKSASGNIIYISKIDNDGVSLIAIQTGWNDKIKIRKDKSELSED